MNELQKQSYVLERAQWPEVKMYLLLTMDPPHEWYQFPPGFVHPMDAIQGQEPTGPVSPLPLRDPETKYKLSNLLGCPHISKNI